ncbi:MAG: HEAT repeat domain-containing protein [Anaerolineae bacterium]|nr:HEAT repeat domain-containing protein [Anaerolineae bacterium]
MAHVFVSYKHDDGDFAAALKQHIEAAGFDVWMDIDLRAGDVWREAIDHALRQSYVCVVIMTPAASESPYVTYEWAYAWGAGVRVIPVLLEPTDLHPRLEALQYLDFTDRMNRPWDTLLQHIGDIAGEYQAVAIHVPRDAPPAVKQAVLALDSPDSDERVAAMDSLAQMDHPAAVQVLLGALNHPTRDVRIQAVMRLAAMPGVTDDRIAPVLVEALEHDDYTVRRDAARALKDVGDAGAVPKLIDRLLDEASSVRQAAIGALGALGDESVIPHLVAYLDDKTFLVRKAAVEALAGFGEAAVPGLVKALGDEHHEIRPLAAAILADIGPAAVPALRDALNDPDWRVRVNAAATLGTIGDAVVVPDLIPLLREQGREGGGSRAVRQTAARALGRIGDPAAIQPLVTALNAKDHKDVKDDIARALLAIDTPEARHAVEQWAKRSRWLPR